MNKFIKVLLFILSLLLLVGLVMVLSQFLVIPAVTNATRNAMENTSWVTVALAVVVLFFLISTFVGLVADILAPARKNIEMKRDIGHIEISDKSIESVAGMAMSEVPGVQRYAAKVKSTPGHNKVHLDLAADIDRTHPMAATGQDLQNHVAQRVSSSLGIDPSDVNVKIEPFNTADKSKYGSNMPRVM